MTSTTQPIIALAIKHGASSYTNRADTQHPAYGFTEAALTAFAQDLLAGQCLHQIAEPAAPVVKPIKDAIDALVMAAFTEGGCSEHRMSEARIQTELRKKELRTLLSTPQPCSRSHPHEEMTAQCELRTEIARLTNALARAEAQLAAAPQEDAIAEIVSASHDSAEFGERGINFLRDFQHLEYGTKLYPAPAAPQAVQAAAPLPLLLRDIARDLGITVPQACIALKPLGNYSTNSAVTSEMAKKLREAFPTPAHPAEGVPAQAPQNLLAELERIAEKYAWAFQDAGTETYAEQVQAKTRKAKQALTAELKSALATRPTQQGLDAIAALEALVRDADSEPDGDYLDGAGKNRVAVHRKGIELARAIAAQAKQGAQA